MTNELWRWSAVDLAQAIRKREVSSREAVQSCLQRAQQLNPVFNPLTEICADQALKAADAADAAAGGGAARGGRPRPRADQKSMSRFTYTARPWMP